MKDTNWVVETENDDFDALAKRVQKTAADLIRSIEEQKLSMENLKLKVFRREEP